MPKAPVDKDKPARAAVAKAKAKPVAKAAPKPEVAFPKKQQPPTPAAFAARLPVALGKRLDATRAFLLKQKGVGEDVHFYGPKSGWALRYLAGARPLCSLHLHGDAPLGLLSLDAAAMAGVDWKALSPVAQKARKQAHGSPTQLWLDVPLDGEGGNDFKALVRAKLAAIAPAAAAAPSTTRAYAAVTPPSKRGFRNDP